MRFGRNRISQGLRLAFGGLHEEKAGRCRRALLGLRDVFQMDRAGAQHCYTPSVEALTGLRTSWGSPTPSEGNCYSYGTTFNDILLYGTIGEGRVRLWSTRWVGLSR